MAYQEPTIYSLLLELPLFQGLSSSDLQEVVAHTRFDFTKAKEETVIIHENKACDGIVFLLNGKVMTERKANNNSYRVHETVHAPVVFGLESLFGLSPYYNKTYTTLTTCHMLTLSKNEVLKLSRQFLVFHLNLMNLISTQLQRYERLQWHQSSESVRILIIRFFLRHCQHPAGDKTFFIRMEDLAREIHDSRLDVSRALNAMQQEGLLTLSRGKIHIPAIEKLVHQTV